MQWSLLKRVPCVPAWSTWARASFSFLRANVPNACQLFNLTCQHAKGVPIFQLGVQGAKMGANFSTSPAKRRPSFSTIFKEIFPFFSYA